MRIGLDLESISTRLQMFLDLQSVGSDLTSESTGVDLDLESARADLDTRSTETWHPGDHPGVCVWPDPGVARDSEFTGLGLQLGVWVLAWRPGLRELV